jgi:anti-sigma regulatory factor (Ser/Thr protein kinase)
VRATETFPAALESAAAARHFAEDQLRQWGSDDLLETTRLLVSELVVNAVLHAGTSAKITIHLNGRCLRVEVVDGGINRVTQQPYEPTAPTGRGLMILDALATRWGVDEADDHKTVWFELDRETPGSASRTASSSDRRS